VGCLLLAATQQVIVKLNSYVGMPALAEVARENPDRLKQAYLRFRLPIDALCVTAAGFYFISAHSLISFLYDGRYADAGHTLSLLSLGLLASRFGVMDQYFMATGETKQLFKRNLLQTVALYVAVPIAFSLGGMTGALIGILLAQSCIVPLMLKAQKDRGLLDWGFELGTLGFFPLGLLLGWVVSRILQ
jgi:O-antigen/teichoic acid export membrane protein